MANRVELVNATNVPVTFVDNGDGTYSLLISSQTVDSAGNVIAGTPASVSITRPDNVVPYLANDVVGSSVLTTAALSFPSLRSGAGEYLITTAEFEIDAAAVIAGETTYRLHLYNVTPPSALVDNAPFDIPAGDRASYLGFLDLGAPVDLGSTLYVQTPAINKQITLLASGGAFGYLVTIGAYTPTALRVFNAKLHGIPV
jgi:hypothetical protein